MPAWDNVSLQGPPQAPSYMAPQIGMQLGALLGNLPQDYLQGVQQQQQIRQLGLINQILGQQGGGGQQARPAGRQHLRRPERRSIVFHIADGVRRSARQNPGDPGQGGKIQC